MGNAKFVGGKVINDSNSVSGWLAKIGFLLGLGVCVDLVPQEAALPCMFILAVPVLAPDLLALTKLYSGRQVRESLIESSALALNNGQSMDRCARSTWNLLNIAISLLAAACYGAAGYGFGTESDQQLTLLGAAVALSIGASTLEYKEAAQLQKQCTRQASMSKIERNLVVATVLIMAASAVALYYANPLQASPQKLAGIIGLTAGIKMGELGFKARADQVMKSMIHEANPTIKAQGIALNSYSISSVFPRLKIPRYLMAMAAEMALHAALAGVGYATANKENDLGGTLAFGAGSSLLVVGMFGQAHKAQFDRYQTVIEEVQSEEGEVNRGP